MAITKVTSGGITADAIDGTKIADDAINSEHLADGSIDNAHIADDQIDSEHYAAGSVDDAHLATGITASKLTGALPAIDGSNLTGITTDTTTIENNIAMLAFFRASDNSKAKYSLVDQVVDEYVDATGIDAGNSTNESLTSGYYSGNLLPTHDADVTGVDGNDTWYKWTDTSATGTFTPAVGADYEYLVVAGGGGGGRKGGGGGAGGYRAGTLTLSAQSYTVTVGAGGAGFACWSGGGPFGGAGPNFADGGLFGGVGMGARRASWQAAFAAEMAALWVVLTRLKRPSPKNHSPDLAPVVARLTPLQKALLYDHGETPIGMKEEERKLLCQNVRNLRFGTRIAIASDQAQPPLLHVVSAHFF